METDTPASLRQQVDAVPYWHHTIDLGHGVVTPGRGGDTSYGLARIALPEDLSGKTVLDIGAWDGAYSFECERRGAARVVAADRYIWRDVGWDGKAGFELARTALGSSVEDLEIDVFDITPESVGMFDVVLFLGVLYHLRDPFGGLARAASVARERLIVETHVDFLSEPRPAFGFYPGTELCGDATNWFGPNVPALTGMLENLDFEEVRLIGVEPNVGDQEWLSRSGGQPIQDTRRAVMHAHRQRQNAGGDEHVASTAHAASEQVSDLTLQVVELRHRAADLEKELADARRVIEVQRNMKAVRWSAWLRRMVYSLRGRRG